MLASDILYLFAIWSSRCSSVFFFQRLTQTTRHEIVWKGLLAAIIAIGAASILTIALRCNVSHSWLFINERCTDIVIALPLVSRDCNMLMCVHSTADGWQ